MHASIIAIGLLLPGIVPDEKGELFQAELTRVREDRVQDVGREKVVANYLRFVEAFPKHPRVAEAMIELASLFECQDLAKGMFSDGQSALVWFRKAAAAAPVGSELWIRAQILVCTRVSDLEESQQILESMARRCDGNLVTLANVEYYLIRVCLLEKKFAEAERHCLALMDWYDEPARMPKAMLDKGKIDSLRLFAGGEMLNAWATAPWSKADRRRKVNEFADQYANWGGFLAASVERVLKQIDADGRD